MKTHEIETRAGLHCREPEAEPGAHPHVPQMKLTQCRFTAGTEGLPEYTLREMFDMDMS